MSILDIKTGTKIKWHGIQLMAYEYLLEEYKKESIFLSEKHIYTVNNEVFESVSRTLEKAGRIDKTFFSPATALRGNEVHELTMLIDTEVLTIDDITNYKGYIESYLLWKEAFKPVYTGIELKVCSSKLKIAGTIDRVLNPDNKNRFCLYLNKDGKIANMIKYNNPLDSIAWISCMNLLNWERS